MKDRATGGESSVPVITAADMRGTAREVSVTLDAALVVAEHLAAHQIIPSRSFDQLVGLLMEASEAAAWLAEGHQVGEPTLVFPSRTRALAHCMQNPHPDPEAVFTIREDENGRCVVGVCRLISYL